MVVIIMTVISYLCKLLCSGENIESLLETVSQLVYVRQIKSTRLPLGQKAKAVVEWALRVCASVVIGEEYNGSRVDIVSQSDSMQL